MKGISVEAMYVIRSKVAPSSYGCILLEYYKTAFGTRKQYITIHLHNTSALFLWTSVAYWFAKLNESLHLLAKSFI